MYKQKTPPIFNTNTLGRPGPRGWVAAKRLLALLGGVRDETDDLSQETILASVFLSEGKGRSESRVSHHRTERFRPKHLGERMKVSARRGGEGSDRRKDRKK